MHYFSKKQDSENRQKKIEVFLRNNKLSFLLSSGVFSKTQVDKGTELLVESAVIQPQWKVLDLGCGNGIVGIAIAKSFPKANILMSDVNERAVVTAIENIELNNIRNAKAVESNLFENIKSKFDSILINPPQSAGKDICKKMIEQSKQHLNKGGLLQLVAREKKGGKSLNIMINDIFGSCHVIAKSSGYWIYAAKND